MLCPKCEREYDDGQVFCPDDGEALKPAIDPLIGRVIADRLEIKKKLGEGGMGRVYLAQHTRLPLQTAVKVLHPQLVHDAEMLRRFYDEAERAALIRDEHVAQVHDFGKTPDGLVYLEMEFVDGRPLSKLLEETGALAPDRVADILGQIATALVAAHELRIVHRDLKPDNVMIGTGRDGADRVKVVDFGIAKVMADGVAKSTQTGQVIGTPDYMSPEQLAGARDLDGRSDIYSLGLVAFAMLTGELAFPGELPYERMMKRLAEGPRMLGEAKRDVAWPASLQAAVSRALARAPGERYGTATEFARDLSRAIADWTPDARAARGRWFRLTHVRLPRLRPAYRWAPLPLVLMLGLGAVIYFGRRSSPIPPGPKTDTNRSTIGSTPDTSIRQSAGDVTPPPPKRDRRWIQQQLASARALLAPGEQTSTADASKALRIAQGVLPYALTVADSVEAQYQQVEAYLVLTAVDDQAAARACRILQRLREPARNTAFAQRVALLASSPLASACTS
jgi:serine/threonine-protein kinase